jgi:hypothetical protein
MLEFIKSLIENRAKLPHLVSIVDNVRNIVEILEKEYAQDGDAKDAMIDTIMQLLQGNKTQKPSS